MRAPAGYYPASQAIQHVYMAGAAIYCAGCETHGKLPLPRAPEYNRQVEDFLERHRLCRVTAVRS